MGKKGAELVVWTIQPSLFLPWTAVLCFETLQSHSELNVSFLKNESSIITLLVRRRRYCLITIKFPCIIFKTVSVALPVITVLFLHLSVLLTVCFFCILSQNMLSALSSYLYHIPWLLSFPSCFHGPSLVPLKLMDVLAIFSVYNKAGCCLSAAALGPVANVSGCLWNSIMLVLYRKTSAAFVRLARMYIITKEAVRPYGKLNQTLRSQDELEIGILPVMFLRLRSLADICWKRDQGRREKMEQEKGNF